MFNTVVEVYLLVENNRYYDIIRISNEVEQMSINANRKTHYIDEMLRNNVNYTYFNKK